MEQMNKKITEKNSKEKKKYARKKKNNKTIGFANLFVTTFTVAACVHTKLSSDF